MPKPTLCLLDMDGVLVDLHSTIFRKFGIDKPEDKTLWNNGELLISNEELWAGTDAEWWASLPWTPEGQELLDLCVSYFGRDRIVICTKPAPHPGSADGKLLWLERNIPWLSRSYILTVNKSLLAAPHLCLIDDSDRNVDSFHAAGGRAILVPRIWNRFACHSRSPASFFNSLELDLDLLNA